MSKSFEIHFDSKGNVLVNNIQGVEGNECVSLTDPYTNQLKDDNGESERIMLPESERLKKNTQQEMA